MLKNPPGGVSRENVPPGKPMGREVDSSTMSFVSGKHDLVTGTWT